MSPITKPNLKPEAVRLWRKMSQCLGYPTVRVIGSEEGLDFRSNFYAGDTHQEGRFT